MSQVGRLNPYPMNDKGASELPTIECDPHECNIFAEALSNAFLVSPINAADQLGGEKSEHSGEDELDNGHGKKKRKAAKGKNGKQGKKAKKVQKENRDKDAQPSEEGEPMPPKRQKKELTPYNLFMQAKLADRTFLPELVNHKKRFAAIVKAWALEPKVPQPKAAPKTPTAPKTTKSKAAPKARKPKQDKFDNTGFEKRVGCSHCTKSEKGCWVHNRPDGWYGCGKCRYEESGCRTCRP